MKLSLCMIVRNASDEIEATLESIVPFVSEVCVLETGKADGAFSIATEVCERHEVPLKWSRWEDPNAHPTKGWISDFSEARNKALEMVTGDVWCWIDSDTRLIGGEAWRRAIGQWFESQNADLMEVNYHYDHDENGNLIRSSVSRMVCRAGLFQWRDPVHEQPVPMKALRTYLQADEKDLWHLEHNRSETRSGESGERNAWIVQHWEERGLPMTARLYQGWGSALLGLGRHEEAVEKFGLSLRAEGGSECDYATLIRLGGALICMGKPEKAINRFLQAQGLFPGRVISFCHLADTALRMKDHVRALAWAEIAKSMGTEEDEKGMSFNPTFAKWGPEEVRYKAMIQQCRWGEALVLIKELIEAFSHNKELARDAENVENMLSIETTYMSFKRVEMVTGDTEIWRSAPNELRAYPEAARATNDPLAPSPKVVIYCGEQMEVWGPETEKRGGSEEAVIHLSRALCHAGKYTDIYALPPREIMGQCLPERWFPHYAWKEEDECEVFVAWRAPEFVRKAPNAKKRYVWMHDIVRMELFTDDLFDLIDGIFCLSRFHAEPFIGTKWEQKVVFTQNGIHESMLRDGANDPHRFIYCSAPDRGLEQLLRAWPRIRAGVPGAHLDIYYGFTDCYLRAMSGKPHLRRIKAVIDEMMETVEGVTWYGMVPEARLSDAFAECGFWLYPSMWPETSCISAMKAQAMGCVPITARYPSSAVIETCGEYDCGPEGLEFPFSEHPESFDEWIKQVIRTAGKGIDPGFRPAMKAAARERFDWQKVASQWCGIFFSEESSTDGAEQPADESVRV